MRKLIYIIIIYSFLLSGCSASGVYANYRGIEELELVQTFGIDAHDSGVCITTASTASAEAKPPTVLSRTGFAISETTQSLQDYSANSRLFYAHAQNIVIGEEAAANGIGDYLDYIIRSTQMRMGTSMYIVRGDTAKNLITGSSSDENYNITKILESLRRDVDTIGSSHVYSCRDVARSLAETGAALVCAIEIKPTEGSVFSAASESTALPAGYGIISDGRLVGFIDGDMALATGMIMGEGGVGKLPLYDNEGAKVTVEYELGKCSVKPSWAADGSLACIDVKAELTASVAEVDAQRYNGSEEYTRQLEEIIESKIRAALQEVIALSGELKADFLKLGRVVKADSAAKFAALGGHFENSISSIPFNIEVDATVERSYVLRGTVSTDGSGGK